MDAALNALFAASSVTHLHLSGRPDADDECGFEGDAELLGVQWPPLLRTLLLSAWRTPLSAADWKPPVSLV